VPSLPQSTTTSPDRRNLPLTRSWKTRERQEAFLQEGKDTIREALQASGTGLGGLATLMQNVQPAPLQDEAMSEEAFDTAMEFISGL